MRYEPIFSRLRQIPPAGWRVVHNGSGVYLWPTGLCEFRNQAHDPLLADWEILFEVFCLKGEAKITARARPAGPNFRCFLEASEKSGLKILKTGKAGSKTKAVAIWRLGKLGANADAIAQAVRDFLAKPPTSLANFITELRKCCRQKQSFPPAAPATVPQTLPQSCHSTKPLGRKHGSLKASASAPPPRVGNAATPFDVIAALVAWIQADPFQRMQRMGGAVNAVARAPLVQGWDQRLMQYAYATNRTLIPDFVNAFAFRANMAAALAGILPQRALPNVPTAPIRAALSIWAAQICNWGGVPQRSYAPAWTVVDSAVSGFRRGGPPMNSGWTKVASFATDGLPNAQTIWDSRVSTSLIWRIDSILAANGLPQGLVTNNFDLGLIRSRGAGLRPLRIAALNFHWPNAYGRWNFHFGGSAVVREMVAILNAQANGYPRMPLPGGGLGDWDVFGVGLVLFMDGY